jgi:hypothetical protein
MKRLFVFMLFVLVLGWVNAFSQVAINESGAPPDNSAMLDISSGNKGLLLPRIDFLDRPDPAAPGLMIYVTANGPNGNDALYIYNGVAWLKLLTAIGIGVQAQGGIVFWLDSTGTHGLVSATEDQGYAAWGCLNTLIGPDAQHSGFGSGDTNTVAILNGCTEPDIAASICDNLDLNGYSDWYLPAVDELWQMFLQRNVIGGFTNYLYWSSTESSFEGDPPYGAWIVWFDGDGLSGWTGKDSYLPVRCVRKF